MYKVITVDDEPMIKRTLKKLIDATGAFEVVAEAEDGKEALELIERFAPDVVMTDIRMPVMDGLELIGAMHERNVKAEVVIVSGYDDFAYAQKAIRFGIADYLLKPIKPALLQETLDRLLERFEKRKQSYAERSGRIVHWKKRADDIAERIWLLEEEAAAAELRQFRQALETKGASPEEIREAFLELLSFVDGNLAEKGAALFENGSGREAFVTSAEDPLERAIAMVAGAVERIRKARNWGSHHGIQRAVEYMKSHFTEESLSLQEVADHVPMSPAYFSRSFKEEMGVSFIHFLTQLRMEKAKELLADPDCKTYEIASSIGYVDYPHFAKVFKKYTGMSPTEYRKRLGVL